ncbi:MAG TPA: hypothetical protein VNO21_02450, partial [Polyangiaceae bacterium]|nr:hypothetical protein [Polyangiaceae bacterium]
DASYVYELEIRDGAPCRATRTGPDGSVLRGGRALAAMLGVWAGRFHVAPSEEPIASELLGTLRAQTAEPIAYARGAAHLLSGARALGVAKVSVDAEIIAGYLAATPEPMRKLVERVTAGESPRQVLLRGNVDPVLLEAALIDLALRGAIGEVRGVQDEDLLRPATDVALRLGVAPAGTSAPDAADDEAPAPVAAEDERPERVSALADITPGPSASESGSGEDENAGTLFLAAGAETSDTPMTATNVAVKAAMRSERKDRRWLGAAAFGAVVITVLVARYSAGASTTTVGAASGMETTDPVSARDESGEPAVHAPQGEAPSPPSLVERGALRWEGAPSVAEATENERAHRRAPVPILPARRNQVSSQTSKGADGGVKPSVSTGTTGTAAEDVVGAAVGEPHSPNVSPPAP